MGKIYCKHCLAGIQDAGPVGRKHLKEAHNINTDIMSWDLHFETTKGGAKGIFDAGRLGY